jgi:hypothetical protein
MSSAIDSLLLFRSEKTEVDSRDPSPSQCPTCDEHDGGGAAIAPTASKNPEAPQDVLAALYTMSRAIDERLVRAEHLLLRTEALVADRTLRDLCTRIEARLVRSGDDLQALQNAVMSLDSRLLRVEELVQSTATAVTDKSRPQRVAPRPWRRENP